MAATGLTPNLSRMPNNCRRVISTPAKRPVFVHFLSMIDGALQIVLDGQQSFEQALVAELHQVGSILLHPFLIIFELRSRRSNLSCPSAASLAFASSPASTLSRGFCSLFSFSVEDGPSAFSLSLGTFSRTPSPAFTAAEGVYGP